MPKLFKHLLLCLVLNFSLAGFSQNSLQEMIEKAEAVYDENPAESFALYEKAEKKAENENEHSLDGEIQRGKGRFLLLIGQYDAATVALNKAILIFTENGNNEKLSSVYSIKSIMLQRIGDSKASHNILLKALEIDKKANNKAGMRARFSNLSLDYYRFGQADSMRYCLEELEKLLSKENPREYYYYYQNWGSYFYLIKEYDRAIQQYNYALEIAEKQKMTDSKATVFMLLSRAYSGKQDLNMAEDFAERSYIFSEENNLKYESSEALAQLVKVLQAKGDYKAAFDFQEKWVRIDKEINDLEKIQKVKIIESQLKLVEKEKEIVEGESALKEEQLQSQKIRARNAWLVAVLVVIAILLLFTAYIYSKTRKLNATIRLQKEEVEYKSLKLEDALLSIEDSLNYSKLIQESMLPSMDLFQSSFNDQSVLYKPKDIVSGDFYWINRVGEELIFAVGDCTGHGVPGAMVSMVCFEALNKAVLELNITEPKDILHEVRKIVVKTFSNKDKSLNDGMDIAICKLSGQTLTYAGANNPLWICRNGAFEQNLMELERVKISPSKDSKTSLLSIKASKQPIGKYDHNIEFDQTAVHLLRGDLIYLFSDGYADQFGGEKGKKYKSSNFKELLIRIKNHSLADQKEKLEKSFEDWKGSLEQVDDICVLMLKV